MNLTELRDMIHANAKAAGWWTNLETGKPRERNKAELICLMHSELSEAMEGVRKGLQDDHLPTRPMEEVELADCIIRILDYCGGFGLDIEGAVIEKIAYNKNRADHKVENRKKSGGKKF
jgi:NTP pyrophosphatase (non-canonical NTP hydrolase)